MYESIKCLLCSRVIKYMTGMRQVNKHSPLNTASSNMRNTTLVLCEKVKALSNRIVLTG